jgi:hypothetical protein
MKYLDLILPAWLLLLTPVLAEEARSQPAPWPDKWGSRWEIGQFCGGKAEALQREKVLGGHFAVSELSDNQIQALRTAHMTKAEWETFYNKCVADELFSTGAKPRGLRKHRDHDGAGDR